MTINAIDIIWTILMVVCFKLDMKLVGWLMAVVLFISILKGGLGA